jgi:hypothetical protein
MFKRRMFKQTLSTFRSGGTVEEHGFQPCRSRCSDMRLSAAAGLSFLYPSICIALLASAVLCFNASLRAQSPDLPPGAAQAKVRTACLECHDENIIVQQRLSKAAWTKEVDKMIKWGALVEAADRDSFIDYLSTNFPPEKAPAEMPRAASAKKH